MLRKRRSHAPDAGELNELKNKNNKKLEKLPDDAITTKR